jgi:hypothetical protein
MTPSLRRSDDELIRLRAVLFRTNFEDVIFAAVGRHK